MKIAGRLFVSDRVMDLHDNRSRDIYGDESGRIACWTVVPTQKTKWTTVTISLKFDFSIVRGFSSIGNTLQDFQRQAFLFVVKRCQKYPKIN